MSRFALVFLLSVPAWAVEIDISFDALQKIIGTQMFTEDGRRYVRGNKSAKCNFAYLENPRIAGAGEMLRVQAKFSGRSAVDMFGKCVGLGDSFDLTIYATPYTNQGTVLFKEVKVDANGRHGFYLDRVVAQLQKTFASTFKLSVDEEAKRLLDFPQAPPGALSRKVDGFKLEGIRVVKDAVSLKVDFHVTVR